MKILVLTMGGTIDAQAFPEGETPYYSTPGDGHLAVRTLKELAQDHKIQAAFTCIEICNKDSKDLDDNDRKKLADAALENAQGYERIVVTTGTDKMTDTAHDLKHKIAAFSLPCPLVFTGAMWPLANTELSDGRANLELAAFSNHNAKPDIYIAMHGLFVPCGQIRKDFEKRKFVLNDA